MDSYKNGDAMFRVDVDDGNVNRAEYINMLMEISPYMQSLVLLHRTVVLEALRIFSEMHPCPLF
jgi:hypothetical protein